jgi:hypothetical protein
MQRGETKRLAKRLVDSLPQSLEFRTTLTLIDGYGQLLKHLDYDQHKLEWSQNLEILSSDLFSAYPDGEKLRVFLEIILTNIEQNYVGGSASPHILYGRLIQSSSTLAQAMAENALKYPDSRTNQFAGIALSKLMSDDHVYGLTIARKFIETNSQVRCFK